MFTGLLVRALFFTFPDAKSGKRAGSRFQTVGQMPLLQKKALVKISGCADKGVKNQLETFEIYQKEGLRRTSSWEMYRSYKETDAGFGPLKPDYQQKYWRSMKVNILTLI